MTPSQELRLLVETLAFPAGQFVLFGGASLAIRDLRPIGDLDVFATPTLYGQLAQIVNRDMTPAWEEYTPRQDDPSFLRKVVNGTTVDVFHCWTQRKWSPALHLYLRHPQEVLGVPVIPLEEMYVWKLGMGREKDIEDVNLIEAFWKDNH